MINESQLKVKLFERFKETLQTIKDSILIKFMKNWFLNHVKILKIKMMSSHDSYEFFQRNNNTALSYASYKNLSINLKNFQKLMAYA